jgi:hypothetical protein
MIIPTLDQTEGVWIERTKDQGYHSIQAVFPKDTHVEQAHRDNCRMLILRGTLQPEVRDAVPLSQRVWDKNQRYIRVHI